MECETRGRKEVTEEFKAFKSDPDLQSEPGPGGTLIFQDGDQYCCVGPDFVSMEESDSCGFGTTREEAFANYSAKADR